MKRAYHITAVLLFLLLLGIPAFSAETSPVLEFIAEGADAGDAIVSSGRGIVRYEYVRIDSLGEKAREDDQAHFSRLDENTEVVIKNYERIVLNVAFKGSKIRCEELSRSRFPDGRPYTQQWIWAYNGEKMDLLRLDGLGDNDLIIPIGSIRTNNDIPLSKFDPRYYGMGILGAPVASFAVGDLDDRKIEGIAVAGEEVLDGVLCRVVQGTIAETKETVKAWLPQDMMFRPVRVEIAAATGFVEIDNQFRKHADGSWFTKRVERKEHYISASGKRVLYKKEVLTVDDAFEVNVDIPSETFEIDFPRGMSVRDYRLGKTVLIE